MTVSELINQLEAHCEPTDELKIAFESGVRMDVEQIVPCEGVVILTDTYERERMDKHPEFYGLKE